MDHPLRLDPEIAVRPWQRATMLIAVIAAVELVLLIVAGGALLAKPGAARHATARANPSAEAAARTSPKAASTHAAAATGKPSKTATAAAQLPRGKVKVVVLNGNGRQGAAAAAATRVEGRGYRVGLVANAPQSDYPQTIVMYRRGFEGEALRLAHDLGVKVVSPLDGMRPAELDGAQTVLILGG